MADSDVLAEFTLSAKCAGSSKHIQLTREISGWHRSWSTTMEPRDWIARDSICREIQGDLKFIIEMSGDFSRVRVAIGDSNNKVKIADGPQDGVFVRGSMSLDAAMPVANLKKISVVVASETRTDRQTNVRFNGRDPNRPPLYGPLTAFSRHPRAGPMQGLWPVHVQPGSEPGK